MKCSSLFTQCLVIPAMLMLASCDPFWGRGTSEPVPQYPEEADGWAPVYKESGTSTVIKSMGPQTIEKGGKIYILGNTLYQVETGKGIHVIDISNPSSPQKQAFISVTGAQEVSIKGNYLYTNNINDLVVLNISNIQDVKLEDRISNVFHLVDPNLPPGSGYYECVDPEKGEVVGWEQKLIKKPRCSNL